MVHTVLVALIVLKIIATCVNASLESAELKSPELASIKSESIRIDKSHPAFAAVALLMLAILVVGISGLIGVAFGWKPGLWMFAFSMVMDFVLPPLIRPRNAFLGWHQSMSYAEAVLSGAIVAIGFLVPGAFPH